MSRHAARRPDQGIKSTASVTSQLPPQPQEAEATVGAREDLDRGWIIVQWLWPVCFVVLALSEVALYVFRKATQ